MHLAILRVHKDEQSYNQHWMSVERFSLEGLTGVFKIDIEGQIVHKGRNQVVEGALLDPLWEVAFMMDDDMVYAPDTLTRAAARFTEHPEIAVLTGVYFSKRLPHMPQLYEQAPEAFFRNKFWPILDYRERAQDNLLQVGACGAGFLFVRRVVFERVKPPWFLFLDQMGEDFYFCRKAQKAGFDIWCDTSQVAIHLGVIPIDEGIFVRVRPILKRVLPKLQDGIPEIGEMEICVPS